MPADRRDRALSSPPHPYSRPSAQQGYKDDPSFPSSPLVEYDNNLFTPPPEDYVPRSSAIKPLEGNCLLLYDTPGQPLSTFTQSNSTNAVQTTVVEPFPQTLASIDPVFKPRSIPSSPVPVVPLGTSHSLTLVHTTPSPSVLTATQLTSDERLAQITIHAQDVANLIECWDLLYAHGMGDSEEARGVAAEVIPYISTLVNQTLRLTLNYETQSTSE